MQTQDHPLRLAVGSHEAGSGRGCAMNVLSWENGDAQITDLPDCADPMLARVVQRVNDTHCSHLSADLLCPPCSVEVLALAHRTVGTRLDLPPAEYARVHVRMALWCAEQVEQRTEAGRRAVTLVRDWLDGGPVTSGQLWEARNAAADAAAADAAADAAAADAAAAAAAADAAADAAAVAAVAADAYAAAAYAAADAAAVAADAAADAAAVAADAYASRLTFAHRVIDEFERITGIKGKAPSRETTERALAQMLAVGA